MSIGLSFSKSIIFLKIFNSEIKSNSSIPTNYHVLKIFQGLSIFLSKMKYLYTVIHKTFALFCS